MAGFEVGAADDDGDADAEVGAAEVADADVAAVLPGEDAADDGGVALVPGVSEPLGASPAVVGVVGGAVGTDVGASAVVALSVSGAGAGTNSVADGGTV